MRRNLLALGDVHWLSWESQSVLSELLRSLQTQAAAVIRSKIKTTKIFWDMWYIDTEWPELWKINAQHSEVFISYYSGHEEFIKLILLLFCFAQRLSFPCDIQKRKSVVTRLNWKDLINSSATWGLEITSSANRE